MKADWSPAQCILCLDNDPLCEEHLIPHSIGGILTCSFLCQSCNSNLGYRVDATAKQDPSVLLAVLQLRNELPTLYQRLIESHRHVSIREMPRISGFIRNQEFQVSPQRCDDGSLVLPFEEARKAIRTMLQRQGSSASAINAALDRLDAMPTNRRISIAPELDVISRTPTGIELDLSHSKLLDPRLPAKIAFEFLALCVGSQFFTLERPLAKLRQMLRSGSDLDNSLIRVDRSRIGGARPFHGICTESNSEHIQIQIRLFGCLTFRVHFLALNAPDLRFAYTHRLDTQAEYVERIAAD